MGGRKKDPSQYMWLESQKWEQVFEKMTKNLKNVMKRVNLKIQEAQWTPSTQIYL